jgi:hypothetical protein
MPWLLIFLCMLAEQDREQTMLPASGVLTISSTDASFLIQATPSATPKTASLQLVEVRWAYENDGLGAAVECDPPAPKSSNLACWKQLKEWHAYCDDPRTVDTLPHIENRFAFDANKAHDNGDKYWCVIAVEN